MISTLEKEITFRFLKARKKDGFLNVISIFSFIGISLGVAVLIIVMSVMNGFRTELIDKIVGFNAHAVVKPYDKPLASLPDKDFAKDVLSNDGEAVIFHKNGTKGVLLKGYLEKDFKDLEISNNDSFFGSKNLNENTISIGRDLSNILGLDIGDEVSITSPSGVQTLVGSLPKQKLFLITSIFESGLSEYDENIAYINLNTLEDFFDKNKNDRFTEYYFKDPKNIENHKEKLMKLYPDAFVYTWADMNSSLFSALKVERNVMFIILSLIIIVAAFNIISGLTILVKNKTRDIAILKSIGVLNKSIIKIFFLVGVSIGTSATIFGIFLGVTFSIYVENIRQFLSSTFNISLFPEEIYFLSKMPSEININSIVIITICSILITIVVSIFPALKAANMDPILELINIRKSFTTEKKINVLRGISRKFKLGKTYAIMGPSGSGKSTLLNLISLIDKPTSGTIKFDNHEINFSQNEKNDLFRSKRIGIVYQENNLLSDFTALENVYFASLSLNNDKKLALSKAEKLLKKIGLSNRLNHFPSQLSGGEAQRVAIARAIINDPQIILADEPTGSLDMNTAKDIFKLLNNQKRSDRIIIFATHNRFFAKKADYLLEMRDGSIKSSNA